MALRYASHMYGDPLSSIANDAEFERICRFCFTEIKHLIPPRNLVEELYILIQNYARSKFFGPKYLVYGLSAIQEILMHELTEKEECACFVVLAGNVVFYFCFTRKPNWEVCG